MTRKTKAALNLAAAVSAAALAAGHAWAFYPPPSIHLLCSAAANGGTLQGSVCELPPGQTTAPNSYSAAIAVSKAGAAGPTVSFALTAGSLPPGLSMPAQGASGTVISGNPTQAGTSTFTIKATDGNLTSTQSYQLTITVQGPPDELLCTAATGSFLINGVCVLPDSVSGQPYQAGLPTSHQAGGTLSIVSGALPPGLSLPASFGASGAIIAGTPGQQGSSAFTVQGAGDQGQPLYQRYQINVDQDVPLAINVSNGLSTLPPGMVGGPYAQNFFLSGGAAPYTWAVAAGQLPPGLTLQTFGDPRDANNELAGSPTAVGTFSFTMRLVDFRGDHATQQFTLTVYPALQVITTKLATGTVGVPYSRDLIAHGGVRPYSWFIASGQLPPGLYLGATPPEFNNVLKGTPTQAGTFSFTMQVQDSQDDWASGTMTITIDP